MVFIREGIHIVEGRYNPFSTLCQTETKTTYHLQVRQLSHIRDTNDAIVKLVRAFIKCPISRNSKKISKKLLATTKNHRIQRNFDLAEILSFNPFKQWGVLFIKRPVLVLTSPCTTLGINPLMSHEYLYQYHNVSDRGISIQPYRYQVR